MKMINYLKILKFAMYFCPMISSSYLSPYLLAAGEKPLRQTCHYKSTLESQYQLPEDRKRKAQRKH